MNINKTVFNWLLEKDNPDIRYLTLKNIVNLDKENKDLEESHKEALGKGVIPKILDKMKPDSFWVKPGAGYSPKYKSTVWSLITLAQIGAKITDDPRIEKACNYYLDHAYSPGGYLGHSGTASGAIDCLQGNMCASLTDLGFEDKRLDEAYDWMARSVTGEGVAPQGDKNSKLKYYAYKCGPLFACGANGKKPCAWGATKVMLAFSKLDENKKTKMIQNAIKEGINFLLSYDITKANYPTVNNISPNRSWFKLGFPVYYITDVLQIVEALVDLGFSNNEKVKKTIDFILDKRNKDKSWNLEYNYNGKTWINWGEPGKPNKWVTYRVYKMLNKLKVESIV